ncbi:hypothetical protein HBI34_154430 [Parastagonospora nodorum]|nr:hypothetical protein HBH42_222720 [Parastagonospora nodorum]KAH6365034.1 hypothetical protein HBI34_154430 [Parastagonospora nodorum]
MLASEMITRIVMGSIAAVLSLCFLATSVILYLRQKRASTRLPGAPKWLQPGSDATSECEKGGVKSVGMLEVCEKTWGSEATKALPASIAHYAKGLEVRTTYKTEGVEEATLVDTSDKEARSVVVQDLVSIVDEDESPIDPVAFKHAFSSIPPAPKLDCEQPFIHPFDDPSLENFDFDSFLNDVEKIPPPFTSAPIPQRPSLPLSRKSKRSWDTSNSIDVNFGSMQVKGVREVREDRPKQGY